jgi:hypothetical protein
MEPGWMCRQKSPTTEPLLQELGIYRPEFFDGGGNLETSSANHRKS